MFSLLDIATTVEMNPIGSSMKVSVGLFAGAGGIELGLASSGYEPSLLCDIDESAGAVLSHRFAGATVGSDVFDVHHLPQTSVLAAGFPCQDLSQAGRRTGISGPKSGIVSHVFSLLKDAEFHPEWLLFENVSFMLSLDQGSAMSYLVSQLERQGYSWAYRVVDSRAFGLPQRRKRVYLLASKTQDPRVIHMQEAGDRAEPKWTGGPAGFYWTEGNTGLGWAPGAIPTLKGGSGLGIPSPPAIWFPGDTIGTPDIRDAERLQGFPEGWTEAPSEANAKRRGARWRLVGNAVSVPAASWIGELISSPYDGSAPSGTRMQPSDRWPSAAWGTEGERFAVDRSPWPVEYELPCISDFLNYPLKPLSAKATKGFYSRLSRSTLKRPGQFDEDLRTHIDRMERLNRS